MKFALPPALAPSAARIMSLAAGAGIEVWAVGGTVRDALLGRELRDLDIAVDGDALAFARILARELGATAVPLDDENGVARVVLGANATTREALKHIDVARLRGEVADDLRRRDFTVDAMAAPLAGGDVVDPLGGLDDVAGRLVRMTSTAALDDDPLRLLRAVRIAAELGFAIEPATEDAVRRRAPRVNDAAAERRRDELAHMFALEDAHGALRMLDRAGLLDALLPELAAGRGVTQPPQFHAYDVFEHNLRAVGAMDAMLGAGSSERRWLGDEVWRAFSWCEAELRAYLAEEMSEGRTRAALLKLAALLHDVAKPQTRTVDADGRMRFYGHADEGATVATRIMRRLRFSGRERAFVKTLVAEHLRPVQLAQPGAAPTRRALYRFFRALGDTAPAVVLLALADAAAAKGDEMTREGWARQVAYMNGLLARSVKQEGIVDAPRLLDGRDVMSALGLPEGPRIGEVLEALREAQAAGEVTDRDGALAFVRAQAGGGDGGRR
jgi:putative nucleotidyltransferase with HDIG domain